MNYLLLLSFLLLLTTLLDFSLSSSVSDQCNFKSGTQNLFCHLRSLHTHRFTVGRRKLDGQFADVERAQSLTIKCSNLFHSESQIKSSNFGNLPILNSLEIIECKIRNLPSRAFSGLAHLKSLTVTTNNDIWTPPISLEIHSDAFLELQELEELNLSKNNLWSIQKSTFDVCKLKSLKRLNLSNNHFLDGSDLNFGKRSAIPLVNINVARSKKIFTETEDCSQIQVTQIDLSHNFMSSIENEDLDIVSESLKELDLSSNHLVKIGEKVLHKMPLLSILNLANNRLSEIDDNFFKYNQTINHLDLSNNSLSDIPTSIQYLSSLTTINLSMNNLESKSFIDKTSLNNLKSLKVLNLSHNKIQTLTPLLFTRLLKLEQLLLNNNAIRTIHGQSFSSLTSMSLINLSNNDISELNSSLLTDLKSLKSINLDHNNIKLLPDDFFSKHSGEQNTLESVSICNNKLTSIPMSLSSVTTLKTLDLGENLIESIRQHDFANNAVLYGLRIAGNQISEIQDGQFSNTSQLYVLNLARNKITKIGQKAFRNLSHLRALRLDQNHLKDVNGVVSYLERLQWLNISSNNLKWFDYGMIPKSLEWLDIHSNNIGELANYYGYKMGFALKIIDASHNLITSISKLSFPSSIETILLNSNAINSIEPDAFKDKVSLIRVEVMHNQIKTLQSQSLSISRKRNKEGVPEFYLQGNPLVCDCTMTWMTSFNQHEQQSKVNPGSAIISDYSELMCHQTDVDSQHIGVNIESVHFKSNSSKLDNLSYRTSSMLKVERLSDKVETGFLCPYQTHCFDGCMCCDFYACDCRMQCPQGCTCSHDQNWAINKIECSSRNHTSVPLLIPMDATKMLLDGNTLGDVETNSFTGRGKLIDLFMNNSQITSISPKSLTGLSRLERLYLQNNLLTTIVGHEFEELGKSVREIYLQHNKIHHISSGAFDQLSSLSILRIDHNFLVHFPVWQLTIVHPFLSELHLESNRWDCTCDFLMQFNSFLDNYHDRIYGHKRSIKCYHDEPSPPHIIREEGESVELAYNLMCRSKKQRMISAPMTTTTERHRLRKFLNNRSLLSTKHSGDEMRVKSASAEANDAHTNRAINFQFLMPIIISSSLALVIFSTFIVTVCIFRAKIKQWLYQKSSDIYDSRMTASSLNSNSSSTSYYATSGGNKKLFDVYVSYALADQEFVCQSLAPVLEYSNDHKRSASYKVCLHHRDCPQTASVFDTVTVAIESSSRVIMVVSRAYIETEWPNISLPVQTALSRDVSKLILLIVEGNNDSMLQNDIHRHPDLSNFLKQCASVNWGSTGCLEKLNFFLPEPAFMTFQRNVRLRTIHPSTMPAKRLDSMSSIMKSGQIIQADSLIGRIAADVEMEKQCHNRLSDGVWTYSLATNNENLVQSTPQGSISTQSTSASDFSRLAQADTGYACYDILPARKSHKLPNINCNADNQMAAPPSVSSHHTYQSIPDPASFNVTMNELSRERTTQPAQHIYHTLEPSQLIKSLVALPNTTIQNGATNNVASVAPNKPRRLSNAVTKSHTAQSTSDGEDDEEFDEEYDQNSSYDSSEGNNVNNQVKSHHIHSKSTLSSQQLIPNSPKLCRSNRRRSKEGFQLSSSYKVSGNHSFSQNLNGSTHGNKTELFKNKKLDSQHSEYVV